MNSEMALIQGKSELGGLTIYRAPEEVLEQARRCAVALSEVMKIKKNPVMFPDGKGGKEQYLENEDWQTVAYFYGHTAKVIQTELVDFGDGGRGFKAVAVLLDPNGNEVSRAESMCLNSEEQWGLVAEYEWRDKLDAEGKKIWNDTRKKYESEKVRVGEKPKPLFQLLSMAQTRAISKVISSKFKWVVVLAGFAPTPAEEMIGSETGEHDSETKSSAPVAMPQRKTESATAPPPKGPEATPHQEAPVQAARNQGGPVISEAQAKRFFGIAMGAGRTKPDIKAYLVERFGIEDDRQIPKANYDEACDWAGGK